MSNEHGFNEFIVQGQYSVASNAGTDQGNPYNGYCYGILLVFVNTGDKYNGRDNWLWQIFKEPRLMMRRGLHGNGLINFKQIYIPSNFATYQLRLQARLKFRLLNKNVHY